MELITVFTPTYNRREFLERVYKSLKKQSENDFLWMVVDDGSTDNTREYISSLIRDKQRFRIEYYYKENGGLHTAYNVAIEHLNTKLCMCCDSDDWLPDDCIEKIKRVWNQESNNKCAGIVGLDYDSFGNVIGKKLPDKEYFDLNELLIQGKLIGDKKLVVRSELYKQISPMKTQNGEKHFNPNYYNIVISEKYVWRALNENLCYVEYQIEGMTHNIYKQYVASPNSFIELRKLYLGLNKATLLFKCRHIIHYDAECLLAHRKEDIFGNSSPDRLLSILLYPVGVLYYTYVLRKAQSIR